VRQLGNWIESAVILAERERIDVEHFPGLGVQSLAPPAALWPSGLTLPELERLYIVDTLRRTGGNRTKTAVALGISVRSLHYRLRDYGMNRTNVKAAENRPVPMPSLSRSSRAE
jgi:DNA-binding NtrC family response regulator